MHGMANLGGGLHSLTAFCHNCIDLYSSYPCFPETHMLYSTALTSTFIAVCQTRAYYCRTIDVVLTHHLVLAQLSLVFIVPTHRGMAKLS